MSSPPQAFLGEAGRDRPPLAAFAAATTRNILINNPANAHECARAGAIPLLLRAAAASAASPEDDAAAHAVGALFCLALVEPLHEELRSHGLVKALLPVVKKARSEAVFVQALLALAAVSCAGGRLAQLPRVAAVFDRLDLPAHLARVLRASVSAPDRVYLSMSFATADAVFFVRACSAERSVAARLAELGVLPLLLEVVRSGAGGAAAGADATRATWQICYARCSAGSCGGCDWLLDLLPALKGAQQQGSCGGKGMGGRGGNESFASLGSTAGAPLSPIGSAGSIASQPGSPFSPPSSTGTLSPTSVAAACAAEAALAMQMQQGAVSGAYMFSRGAPAGSRSSGGGHSAAVVAAAGVLTTATAQ